MTVKNVWRARLAAFWALTLPWVAFAESGQMVTSSGGSCGPTGECRVKRLTVVSSAANCVAVDTSVLRVDCFANRVGVNTASPNRDLDVTGDTRTSGTLEVGGTFTGSSTAAACMVLDTNVLKVDCDTNRVGINTTNPTVPLDVTGAATVSSTLTAATVVSQGTGGFDYYGLSGIYGSAVDPSGGVRTAFQFTPVFSYTSADYVCGFSNGSSNVITCDGAGVIRSFTPQLLASVFVGAVTVAGTSYGGDVLPAAAHTVSGVTLRTSAAGSGGSTNFAFRISDGTNHCDCTMACNAVAGNKSLTCAGAGGSGCALPASASLTYSVNSIGDCTTGPTVVGNVQVRGYLTP